LIAAARYIERFRGQLVVIKLGGELLVGDVVLERIVPQLDVLVRCGLRPVIVHGGGMQVDRRCSALGLTIEKHSGRRVTSPAVMAVVLEVVAGELNRSIVDRLRERGLDAAGFDAGLSRAVRCQRRPPVELDGKLVDFGEVGNVLAVTTEAFQWQEARWRIPVLPCIGYDESGNALNVNADAVAAHTAVALGALKLVMLSSVPGVMRSMDDVGPISQLNTQQLRELLAGPAVRGGMRAKLEEALHALAGNVRQVHIISGGEPHTLLRELFTDDGCGTLITAD
jgi:acetylglutamate kinase